jgi:hypothetical protein
VKYEIFQYPLCNADRSVHLEEELWRQIFTTLYYDVKQWAEEWRKVELKTCWWKSGKLRKFVPNALRLIWTNFGTETLRVKILNRVSRRKDSINIKPTLLIGQVILFPYDPHLLPFCVTFGTIHPHTLTLRICNSPQNRHSYYGSKWDDNCAQSALASDILKVKNALVWCVYYVRMYVCNPFTFNNSENPTHKRLVTRPQRDLIWKPRLKPSSPTDSGLLRPL